MPTKKSQSSLICEFELIHNISYDYSLVEYVNNTTPVKIICKTHGVFEQEPKLHLRGNGCRACSYQIRGMNCRNTLDGFINKAKLVHNNKYDYSLVNYVNNRINIEILCKHHGIFKQLPNHHVNGSGCPTCSGNFLSLNMFLARANEVHGDYYIYSASTYVNKKTKIRIDCPIHGTFEQLPSHHMNGSGCPVCKESKGERIIRNYLIENGINFIPQKRFVECRDTKPLPFDFYLPDKNTCIEFDGEQHHNPKSFFGGESGFIDREKKDMIKTKFCVSAGIKLVRINKNNILNFNQII